MWEGENGSVHRFRASIISIACILSDKHKIYKKILLYRFTSVFYLRRTAKVSVTARQLWTLSSYTTYNGVSKSYQKPN